MSGAVTDGRGVLVSGTMGVALGMVVIAVTDEPILGFACGCALAGLYALMAKAISLFVRQTARKKVDAQRSALVRHLGFRPIREDDGVDTVVLDPVKPLLEVPGQGGQPNLVDAAFGDSSQSDQPMVLYLESLVLPMVGEHQGHPVRLSWDTRKRDTFLERPHWEPEYPKSDRGALAVVEDEFDLRITVPLMDPRLEKLAGLTSANTFDSAAGFAGSIWEDGFRAEQPVFIGDVPELAAAMFCIGGGFRWTLLKNAYVLDSRRPAHVYSIEEIEAAMEATVTHQKALLSLVERALEPDTDVPTAIVILAALHDSTPASTAALHQMVFGRPECGQTVSALNVLFTRDDPSDLSPELRALVQRTELTSKLLECVLKTDQLDEAGLLGACRAFDRSVESESRFRPDLALGGVEERNEKNRILMAAIGRAGGHDAIEYLGGRLAETPERYRAATDRARLTILARLGDVEGGGLSVVGLAGGALSFVDQNTEESDALSRNDQTGDGLTSHPENEANPTED